MTPSNEVEKHFLSQSIFLTFALVVLLEEF